MSKVDIIRKHIGSDDFYDLNGTEMLKKILAAMDEYAQEKVSAKNTSELTCDGCGCHPHTIYQTSEGRFCIRCKPAI